MTKTNDIYNLRDKRIWVAGHRGLVGGALLRRLQREQCALLTTTRDDLDLRNQKKTYAWIAENKPDVIILAAAKVGGIGANAKYPADFIGDNLMIQTNVIHGAYLAKVSRLLFLGSSCIYPKAAQNPINENALLSGALEPTNQSYAVAKIAGIKMCAAYRKQYGCDFIAAMPCNLYGVGDRFDEQNAHVIPALMMKAHAAKISGAKTLEVWGSGRPRREFLGADDCADALVHVLTHYNDDTPINIGCGADITIKTLAHMIVDVVGYDGDLRFNEQYPDGTAQKLMDNTKITSLGWSPKIDLRTGLTKMYAWYTKHI